MSDVIDQAASAIKTRLAEIEDERKRLESALSSLKGERRGPGRPRGSGGGSRRRNGRKRAPRGERRRQLLTSIQANPNYKASDHAKEIGVSPNQIYGLTTKLVKDGEISKSSKGTFKIKGPKTDATSV